jgi:hypothetical protein
MKKIVLMAIALLISGALLAQEAETQQLKKSFLVLHGGPSFPVGDFGSKNMGNQEAGFAKTGYSVNLNYGYQFEKNAGITASIFLNNYNTQPFKMSFAGESGTETIELKMDHWQFYGLTAGPMLNFTAGKNIFADLKIMGGVVNANTPQISYQGTVMAKEDWSWAPAIQGGANLRIGAGNNMFVFANADYMYMKPKFTSSYYDENSNWVTTDIKQKMSVVNVSAGIGFSF